MKHHYWEPPIALYLFLGGLAGGILFLAAIFNSFVIPGHAEIFALPVLVSLACVALGCVFLIVDLGQPGVFWRVWTTAKSIIKWGATFLVIAAVFALLFFLAFIGDAWPVFAGMSAFLKPAADFFLIVAGFFGLCIMMYTGIMLSTLKAHAFWATPALPVLFTISAISTGCAAIVLSIGGWPMVGTLENLFAAVAVVEVLHVIDIVLVVAELIVLLTMVLSFLGAGNETAMAAARRWVKRILRASVLGRNGGPGPGRAAAHIHRRRAFRCSHRRRPHPGAVRRLPAALHGGQHRRPRRDPGREPLLQPLGEERCGVHLQVDVRRQPILIVG